MIAAFADRHPLVQLTVRGAGTPTHVQEMLASGAAELGLVATAPSAPATPGLTVLHLETQRFTLLAKDEAALPAGDPVRPADLSGCALIVGQQGTGMRRVADTVRLQAPDIRFAVEVEHREAVLPLVLAGLGIAIVPDSWQAIARSAGAVVRALDCPDVLRVSLLYRSGRLSPAATAFLELAPAVGDPPV